jgi:hypothetical protein
MEKLKVWKKILELNSALEDGMTTPNTVDLNYTLSIFVVLGSITSVPKFSFF